MRIQYGKMGVEVVEILYPEVNTPFQEGHATARAISPQLAAREALRQLNLGQDEIYVKRSRILYEISRWMPKRVGWAGIEGDSFDLNTGKKLSLKDIFNVSNDEYMIFYLSKNSLVAFYPKYALVDGAAGPEKEASCQATNCILGGCLLMIDI